MKKIVISLGIIIIIGTLFLVVKRILPKDYGINQETNSPIMINFEKSTFHDFNVKDDIVYIRCELSFENTSEQDKKFNIRANFPEDVGKLLLNNDDLLVKENGVEKVFELKANESIEYQEVIFEGKFGGKEQKSNRLLTKKIKIVIK